MCCNAQSHRLSAGACCGSGWAGGDTLPESETVSRVQLATLEGEGGKPASELVETEHVEQDLAGVHSSLAPSRPSREEEIPSGASVPPEKLFFKATPRLEQDAVPRSQVLVGGRRLILQPLPLALQGYLLAARSRLERDAPVVPCEGCGDESDPTLHGNVEGFAAGFCSVECHGRWERRGAEALQAAVQGRSVSDLFHGGGAWQHVDADLAARYGPRGNFSLPPSSKLRGLVDAALAARAAKCSDILWRATDGEREVLEAWQASPQPVWPQDVPEAELRDREMQQSAPLSLAATYAAGLEVFEDLFRLSSALALAVSSKDSPIEILYSVKGPVRLLERTRSKEPTGAKNADFRTCNDVYRTSVVLDSCMQVQEALTILRGLGRGEQDITKALIMQRLNLSGDIGHYHVERIKNRFVRPAKSRYMDVLASVRIGGYVAEVQLHLRRLWELDEGRCPRLCRWAQQYSAKEGNYRGSLSSTGRKSGFGEYFFLGGERYTGEWLDDVRHGQGCTFYSARDRYDGGFRGDQLHGAGVYSFASGDRYVGEYVDNKRHGSGRYTFANLDVYDGEWRDGRKHGAGEFHSAAGSLFVGQWENDIYHGSGTYFFSTGHCFEGAWVNGRRQGRGVQHYKSGAIELGGYHEGRPSDLGVRWSGDRLKAWRLRDGSPVEEVDLREASTLARGLAHHLASDLSLPGTWEGEQGPPQQPNREAFLVAHRTECAKEKNTRQASTDAC